MPAAGLMLVIFPLLVVPVMHSGNVRAEHDSLVQKE